MHQLQYYFNFALFLQHALATQILDNEKGTRKKTNEKQGNANNVLELPPLIKLKILTELLKMLFENI